MTETTTHPDEGERRELARFLKAMRERVSPAEIGLPIGPRRRSRGLLREEVAQIAGMSATWYTWLEQARPMNPSRRVLDGLSRALRLDSAERAHLFRLARPDLQATKPGGIKRSLDPPLGAILHGLAPHPAYAVNERWDVIAYNAPAARLLGAFDADDPVKSNILSRLFLDPDWRRLFVDFDEIARSSVGQFRAATARVAGDPEFIAFVKSLEDASPEFAILWRRQEIRPPPAWRKTLDHPRVGRMTFDYASFRPEGASESPTFVIYTPADDETARALRKLTG